MDPARDFLDVGTGRRLEPAADGPRERRGGPWAALGRGIGFVVLLVTACSPLWGLAVFFALH